MTDQHQPPTRVSRRRLLRTAPVAVGFPLVAGSARAQTRINRQMVIPSADAFVNAYQGQFVFIDEPTDADADLPLDECAMDSTWPPDETQVYEAQLFDRRRSQGLAVDLNVYMDGRKAQVEPGTLFIIQQTQTCPGDWIGLEAGSVPRRALVGKAPGPTVTPTDGPGFGALAALVGAAGAAALRLLGDDT